MPQWPPSVVSETFRLPDEARTCLDERLRGQRSGPRRRVVGHRRAHRRRAARPLGDGRRGLRHRRAVRRGGRRRDQRGTSRRRTSAEPTAQIECLTSDRRCSSSTPTAMRTLLVGLADAGQPRSTGSWPTARHELVNSLYAACGVDPQPIDAGPATGPNRFRGGAEPTSTIAAP